MKKLTALLLALVMVLAIGATAFADVNKDLGSYEGTQASGFGVDATDPTKIPLTKSIMIFNTEDGTAVRVPNVSFTYAVEPAAASECGTVTDGSNVSAKVIPGEDDGVSGVTIAFDPDNDDPVTAKKTGTEKEKTGYLTVDLDAFDHAGIYRYKITETATNLTESGLESRISGDYDAERFLDLYIVNDTTANKLKISSAIIFKTNSVDDTTGTPVAATTGVNTTTDKTTGYEPGKPGEEEGSDPQDYTNDTEVDRYFTYNVEVTKTITGALADKSHPFPFQITINGTLTNPVTVDVFDRSTTVTSTLTIKNDTPVTASTSLADGESYIVKGLPKGSTVTAKEYNDNTVDEYKVTTVLSGTTSDATYENATDLTKDSSNPMGETDVLINSGNADKVVATENTVLAFTNDMPEISPTGVVMRFAPYAIMLGAGVVLFIILKVRKNKAAEA